MADELTLIGKITNTHALNGGMKLRLAADLIELPEFLYLGISDPPVPFELKEWNDQSGDMAIILLDEIKDKTAASRMIGKEVFASAEIVVEDQTENYKQLEGFSMTDESAGPIGNIEEVVEMPAQIMARVNYNEHEVLVPLNNEIVLSIDTDSQEVLVHLPDGLLDVYN